MRAINSLTAGIIGDAIEVHRELGPGLLESTYEACLASLLVRRRWIVERQVVLPVSFRGERVDAAYRLDLLVEAQVVVEVKTVAAFNTVHFAQLMTYLKFSGCEIGLLINFNVLRLTDGIRRVVRGYPTRSLSSVTSGALCD